MPGWTGFSMHVYDCRRSEVSDNPYANLDRFYGGDFEVLLACPKEQTDLGRLAVQIEKSRALIEGRYPRRFLGLSTRSV